MSDFERDEQLDEILNQIRRKREEEEAYRASRAAVRPEEDADGSKINAEEPEESPPVIEDVLPGVEADTAFLEPLREPEEPIVFQDMPDAPLRKEDVRSLKTAFSGVPQQSFTGEINKTMLAPGLATDRYPENFQDDPDPFDGDEKPERGEESGPHPLFTAEIPKERVIPEEDPALRMAEWEAAGQSAVFNTQGVIVEEFEKVERKGVLNVKENLDDEFKTFFSNTVLIDSKPLTQRRARPKRITDFVVGEEGGPVFDEEDATGSFSEYRSDDETEDVMALLMRDAGRALGKLVLSGVLSALIILFNILLHLEILLPLTAAGNPAVVSGVNAGLMLLAVAVHGKAVFSGFAKLITFRADADSLTAFAALMGLAEPVVMIAAGTAAAGLAACAASAALFFSALGKRMSAQRILQNFANISSDYEKYATTTLPDDAFARRLTRNLMEGEPRILIKRKTGFTDDFLSHAMSRDITNEAVQKPASIAFLIAVACGVISYALTNEPVSAVRALALASVLITPFTATLATALPFGRMQRSLSRIGCVVPGFSAVDEIVDGNCAVLEGREVFPRGNVLLHGIKTFERERIDKAILYAASVLIQSCDTMSHMFLNVIQNKTEMLYPVDNIVYEDGMGFSCWVGQTRLLVGNRKMLQSREIEVPSRDYENRYTKGSSRDAIYLAVAGKLYAMFVVSYGSSNEVKRAMRGFEREGIRILVRTRDFNITAERVAGVYGIPRSMVSVAGDHDMEELSRKTAYSGHSPSVMTHIGSLSSYVGGILSCHKLLGALKISTTIELAAVIIGALLAVLVTLLSGFSFGIFYVFLFQLFWLAVTVLLGMIQRY